MAYERSGNGKQIPLIGDQGSRHLQVHATGLAATRVRQRSPCSISLIVVPVASESVSQASGKLSKVKRKVRHISSLVTTACLQESL